MRLRPTSLTRRLAKKIVDFVAAAQEDGAAKATETAGQPARSSRWSRHC